VIRPGYVSNQALNLREFLLPKIINEADAKKIVKMCAMYFFAIVTLYLIFAITNYGEWSFKSSNTYFRIFENLFIGFSIIKYWRTVVRIFLYLQVILLIYIFIGGHGLKIINTMSLVALVYADFAVAKYIKYRGHITSPFTGFAGPGR
jgi:hypothetical protein